MTHRTILSASVLALLAATPALAHHPGGVGGIETSGAIATIPGDPAGTGPCCDLVLLRVHQARRVERCRTGRGGGAP